jgi:3-dehydroquinate dehydratase I
VSPLIQWLELGKVPRVVGTIITEQFLLEWRDNPQRPPCDLVELRVDGFPSFRHWLEIGLQIENLEIPVIVTIRLAKEGGRWTGLDSDRWPMLENALRCLSGVDVEIESDLAKLVSETATDLNKLCILSHHDFQKTPPLKTMRQMLEWTHERDAIGKIAAAANTDDDLASLRSLLKESWPMPVCLIGMGPLGRETRLTFPLIGSCFTYGYLDTPGAPGQYSAAELTEYFKARTGQAQSG